jgi:hypothetical protein
VGRVHELRQTGQTVRSIAGELKLSKSQVARILASVPPQGTASGV